MIKDRTVLGQQEISRDAFNAHEAVHRTVVGIAAFWPRDRELGEVLLQHVLGFVTGDAEDVEAERGSLS
jgi:hypothetical protein